MTKPPPKIDEDPDYWADQTMMKLLEAVST
jgi:hypothetical protein